MLRYQGQEGDGEGKGRTHSEKGTKEQVEKAKLILQQPAFT